MLVRAAAAHAPSLMPGDHHYPTVIRLGRIGDMIAVTALLALLHERFGRPCNLIGAGPWNEAIFLAHPDVARLWSFARNKPMLLSAAAPSALWALRRSSPAPIYVCEHQAKPLARVRQFLTLGCIDSRRCAFISDEPRGAPENWVDRQLQLGARTPPAAQSLEAADVPANRVYAPRIPLLEEERTACAALIRDRGWAGRDLILIQPGNYRSMSRGSTPSDDKAWPLERWVELLRRLHEHLPQAILVLLGYGREIEVLRQLEVAAALPTAEVIELPLRELFALCEHAHSMISVDTGPAHAAAAFGIPLVVLYGAESSAAWLPRSAGSPVMGLGGPPRSTRVAEISVETVFAAWCSQTPKAVAASA